MAESTPSDHIPGYHFAPEIGWINDPNGLVFFNNRWHLFYQYYEPSLENGMHWGHAVSDDLFHWQHLPVAIAPDKLGHIWSGSAVVDTHNSSGLFGGKPGMACLFTYWDPADGRQCQGLATSVDGLTFTKYPGNPVIPQLRHINGQVDDRDFRDPKVFWHPASSRWVMVVAGGKLRIFSSKNLIDWQFESVAEGLDTECPDLFELPIKDQPDKSMWVLSGGGRWYQLGQFDGHEFTPQGPRQIMHHGPDAYATQTFSDAPDNRRIGISWLFSWAYGCRISSKGIENCFPTGPIAGGCLTVPVEYTLRSTPNGVRLLKHPFAELNAIRHSVPNIKSLELAPQIPNPLAIVTGKQIDVSMRLTPAGNTGRVCLRLPAKGQPSCTVGYNASTKEIFIDRREAGFAEVPSYSGVFTAPVEAASDGSISLRILIDRCSVEVFGGENTAALAAFLLLDAQHDGVKLYAADGTFVLQNLTVKSLSQT